MYSLKPGRGPSLVGGIGGIVAAGFGVVWTIGALSLGAPPFFALFGIVFILAAIGGAIYNFYNAAARNRLSTFDVTTPGEEVDPLARALGHEPRNNSPDAKPEREPRRFEGDFCPFCGAAASPEFDYCPKCGKDI